MPEAAPPLPPLAQLGERRGRLIDIVTVRHHYRNVLTLARTVAVALIAVSSGGPVAICAGWQATPEARMACCLEGVECPMHPAEDDGGTHTRAVTQADADRCCAASEQDDASPTAKALVAVVAQPVVTDSILLPAPATADAPALYRRPPDRVFDVPRNVLLSVFLI
jgi:hypothetical protein